MANFINVHVQECRVGVEAYGSFTADGMTIEDCDVAMELNGEGKNSTLKNSQLLNCDVGVLLGKLDANPELRQEVHEARTVLIEAKDESEAVVALKKSKLGQWLANQKFVDWARLAVAMLED